MSTSGVCYPLHFKGTSFMAYGNTRLFAILLTSLAILHLVGCQEESRLSSVVMDQAVTLEASLTEMDNQNDEGELAGVETVRQEAHYGLYLLLWGVLLLAAAKAGGMLSVRLGQTSTMGELLAGIVIGNLGLIFGSEVIILLREGGAGGELYPLFSTVPYSSQQMVAKMLTTGAHIGLILFMFVLGLQFSFGDWSRAKERGLFLTFLGGSFSFLLCALGSYYCWPHADLRQHLLIGAVFATTSAETAVSLFSRYGKLGTQEARILLNSAVITDLLGVLLLGGVIGITLNGAVIIETWSAFGWSGLLYAISMTVVLILGVSFLGKKLSDQITRVVMPIQSPSIVLLAGLLLIAVSCWVSHSLGVTALIGAYASGVLLRGVRLNSSLHRLGHFEDLIEPFAGVVIPLFFVLLGIQVHLELFSQFATWMTLIVMCVMALAGMQLPGALWSGTTRGRFVIGASLFSRGELALIVLFVSTSYSLSGNSLLSSEILAPAVIAVVLTSFISTIILHRLLPGLLEPAQGIHRYERGSSTSSNPIVTSVEDKEQA